MKVVINKCFGGFSISLEAARFMAERGNEHAKSELAEYDKKKNKRWYGYGYSGDRDGYDRADPDLVAAVEALGDDASGGRAKLKIVEIPDDMEWEIEEYDGNEWVAEKHRTWA